jgi:hypothetical protein
MEPEVSLLCSQDPARALGVEKPQVNKPIKSKLNKVKN